MKFTDFKKHLQTAGAGSIYLLDGEDAYFRDKALSMLRAGIVEPQLNATSFSGAELKGEKIRALSDAVYTLPFLSEKRLVSVTDFYPSEKEYELYLKPLFEKPVETSILVIVNGGGGGKPKAGACDWKKKPNVIAVDCSRADEETVTKWAYLTMKQAGVASDGGACGAVARYCNCDMARVSKETEKLIEYAGAGGKITLADVDNLVYKDAEYKLYELTQAAAGGNYGRFMEIMDGMVGKGLDENAFLNALCSHFRTLLEVATMEGSNAQVAEKLGMKEFAVRKNREQARRFSREALKGYYDALYSASATARAGEITFPSALKTVIVKIFFKKY